MKVTIDQEKCIHCGLCKKACILTRFCGFDSLEQAAEQHCINCGHCVAVCPRQAISHATVKKTEPIGPVPDEQGFLNLLMKTRSVRHFKPSPVGREAYDLMRRVAEYSQSGLNAQEIRLIVIEHPDALAHIRKAAMHMYGKLEKLARFPLTRFFLKLALNRRDYRSVIFESATHTRPAASQTGREDATVISQNIMLAMTSLGLGCCYMGGLVLGCRMLKYQPLLQALQLPEKQEVYQSFVLGAPTLQLRRMPERKRREITFRRISGQRPESSSSYRESRKSKSSSKCWLVLFQRFFPCRARTHSFLSVTLTVMGGVMSFNSLARWARPTSRSMRRMRSYRSDRDMTDRSHSCSR